MSTFDTLPVLLVSAANESVAAEVINELVDNDVTQEYNQDGQTCPLDRAWRLVNKYYTADVRVHTLIDNEEMDLDPAIVEAHIIHLTADEVADACSWLTRRAEAAEGAWRRCDVRVVTADSARPPSALRHWAAAARAELVARREPPPPAPVAPAPFADAHGTERAHAALHAHPWPNLVRVDARAAPPAPRAESAESSSGASSDSESSSAEERRAVEHAEAFVAALGALGDEPRGAGPAHARRDRAEHLVAAFARALGLDPDHL